MPRPPLHAFIDEGGVRSHSAASSDHFVMSAVVLRDEHLPNAQRLLADLRTELNRQPDQVLHWNRIKKPEQRLHAAQRLAARPGIFMSSVVVCKRHSIRGAGTLTDDQAYLYTFRFLLERLSWLARDFPGGSREMKYTLAHIVRFQHAKLTEYEARLRADSSCRVEWACLDPRGGRIDQPNRQENLQLADFAASATFAAFETINGSTNPTYLQALAPRLYRHHGRLAGYGLKLHPGTASAAYPWVAAL